MNRQHWLNGQRYDAALTPRDVDRVARLFERFQDDQDTRSFAPHPFTMAEACRVCTTRQTAVVDPHGRPRRDLYFGYWSISFDLDLWFPPRSPVQLVAYAMLRFAAGFEYPSLGIGVHPSWRGFGVGQHVMTSLHGEAAVRGFDKVRLRVHPDNPAKAFYERLGYVFDGEMDRGQLVGWYDTRGLSGVSK